MRSGGTVGFFWGPKTKTVGLVAEKGKLDFMSWILL